MKLTSWNHAETGAATLISEASHRFTKLQVTDRDCIADRGIDYVRGSLNWGPLSFLNAVSKTFGWWTQRRTDYGEGFHTYALEWTESFL